MRAQLCASSAWTWRRIFHSFEFLEKESRKTTSAFEPARSASSIRLRNSPSSCAENGPGDGPEAASVESDVLILHREVVDAALGRRDPAGDLAGFGDALHQRQHEGAVGRGRNPVAQVLFVEILVHDIALRVHWLPRPAADRAPE